MVKRIQQDMGSQKSDGKGHKSAGTGKWVSGTRKIILPLQQMQGRLLKGKGKVMSVLEPSKKKQTSNGKMVEGKKNVTFKGASKRMKMKSKKMRFPGKAKGKGGKVKFSHKPTPKVPESKVHWSKVHGSKVPESKVHWSKVPESKNIICAWVDKAGFKRQQERCAAKAGKAETVKEVVSSSLPATERTQLMNILQNNGGKKVLH